MKTKIRSDIKVTGDLGGDEIELSLDETSLPHLMNMYIRLYSDPEMAAIREVSTNARDSHIAAGKSKVPIRITMPTKLDPVLRIKDEGVGLSEDDFRRIYSKYGASTKRNTNRQTGSLGVGCKAPLAHVASFTVEGYRDGIKTVVSITREGAAGKMRILNPGGTPTTEPNGVLVQIPASTENNFQLLAERLFKFWPKGSVLVDDKEIPRIEGLQITKDILITKNLPCNYIVMGGVPYEYHPSILTGTEEQRNDYKVVAWVEMAAVDFAPSRENLELTPDTKARIQQIADEANAGLAGSVQKKIDKAKTPVEAAKIMAENIGLVDMRSHEFKYKGEVIPYSIDATVISSYTNSWKQSDHSRSRNVYIQSYTKQLIVTDFTPNNFHASHKKKLQHYVDDHNIIEPGQEDSPYPRRMNYFLCFPEVPDNMLKWIDPKHIAPWEDIRKIKLPSVGNGGSRVAGTYECWTQDGYQGHVDEDDVDTVHPLMYTESKGNGPTNGQMKLLNHFYPKWTVATMGGNRVKKFLRLFPKAKGLWGATNDLSKKFQRTLTKEQKEYLAYKGETRNLTKLDPAKLKDKDLARIIQLVKKDEYKKIASLANELGISFEKKSPWSEYPLLEAAVGGYYGYSDIKSGKMAEHAIAYINAVYKKGN